MTDGERAETWLTRFGEEANPEELEELTDWLAEARAENNAEVLKEVAEADAAAERLALKMAEVEAQAAVMREALDATRVAVFPYDDHGNAARVKVRDALAPNAGRALLTELAALREVADVVNDAIGGLRIGASVEVVMAPVRHALAALHALEVETDA